MNKTIVVLCICLLFLAACQKQYTARPTVKVAFNTFKIDSASIRAIEILDKNAIAYATNKGIVGIVDSIGNHSSLKKIKADSITPHFRALAFNKNKLFALNIGNPALLYKLENNTSTVVYKEIHEKVFYDALHFLDHTNGIAMGDPTNECLSILLTNNGGDTWQKIPCDNLPNISKGEAAFAASNTNIASAGNHIWIATGGKKARVFYSKDKGAHWSVYNTPIVQGKSSTGIYSIAFYNKNQGIICGGDYTNKFGSYANKALTFDGGKTWEVVAKNSAPKYVSCVQYVPNTQGKELFAVSTNGVFYSGTSGKTWDKVSNQGFYSIRIADKNTAWLSGNEKLAKMSIY